MAIDLPFQNHSYQLFADLAQSTIIKRRALHPYLQVLQEHEIRYRWGYPFKLIFNYEGRQFQTYTPGSTKKCFQDIGLPLPSLAALGLPKSQELTNPPDTSQAFVVPSNPKQGRLPWRFNDCKTSVFYLGLKVNLYMSLHLVPFRFLVYPFAVIYLTYPGFPQQTVWIIYMVGFFFRLFLSVRLTFLLVFPGICDHTLILVFADDGRY